MRIHIQNSPDDGQFGVTPQQWQDAVSRAGAAGLEASFANDPAGLAAGLHGATALVSPVSEVYGRFPLAAPDLKMIFCLSAGLDKLAPFDWLPPGVALLNNRGAHGAKAGEFAIMALLMLATHMPQFAAAQQAQRWEKHFGAVLRGRRLTVVGLGSLGGSSAKAAALFGMDITGVRSGTGPHAACTRVVTTDQLDTVLPTTEFLLLACPLTPATQGLLDRRRLGLLPHGAKLVNIGRGGLVDQDAVCDALDSGALGGAVLDVFTPEPVPSGHRLWTTRNLVMTPHVSSDDPATYNPLSLDLFLANLAAMQEGRAMPNQVDVTKGY